MSWSTNRRTGQHFKNRPRKGSQSVRMSQKGSTFEDHPIVDRMPQGKPEDKTGKKNVNWETYVPTYPDGTVSFDNAGFTNTSHGTSCSGCKFYTKGTCKKIRIGGPHGSHPKVEPGNCCNYHVTRANPTPARQAGDAVNVVANENVFPA